MTTFTVLLLSFQICAVTCERTVTVAGAIANTDGCYQAGAQYCREATFSSAPVDGYCETVLTSFSATLTWPISRNQALCGRQWRARIRMPRPASMTLEHRGHIRWVDLCIQLSGWGCRRDGSALEQAGGDLSEEVRFFFYASSRRGRSSRGLSPLGLASTAASGSRKRSLSLLLHFQSSGCGHVLGAAPPSTGIETATGTADPRSRRKALNQRRTPATLTRHFLGGFCFHPHCVRQEGGQKGKKEKN
ncbi:hypothetical protein DFH27DRAFT_190551 [Peziza echinospora]|nr:hypothetical protein DFH27DRAFT_190551 [Peziza echinospora]